MVQTAITAKKHQVAVLLQKEGIDFLRLEVTEMAVRVGEEADGDGLSFGSVRGRILTVDRWCDVLLIDFQESRFKPGINEKTEADDGEYSDDDEKRHVSSLLSRFVSRKRALSDEKSCFFPILSPSREFVVKKYNSICYNHVEIERILCVAAQ